MLANIEMQREEVAMSQNLEISKKHLLGMTVVHETT